MESLFMSNSRNEIIQKNYLGEKNTKICPCCMNRRDELTSRISFKCYNYQKYSVSSLITETDYKEEEKLTSDREDVDRFLWYLRLIAPRMAWRQSPPLLWFVWRKHLLVCWEKLSGDRKKEGTKWRLESSSKQLGNKCTLSQAKRGWG